ncbi:PIG-L family deacetylase [Flavihumibacter stibioxidans]|uniref:LmbE family protein n=1 Tax=Flavihumibacter stibioxidans TaxID=1834163 RepID=A0ABR7MCQ6_9BACT|nr:PIG-L deacetylase family protein [Flavihumibacter stibioxidans]MBC6492810.1 LmbE family protein [Flavihumibacter stibioxidans]
MSSKNRREFLQQGLAATAMLSLPSLLNARPAGTNEKRKIVCVGGHPDDPESGCGGTLAKLAKAGHSITIIYLTTGEAGIPGKSHAEAAAIRKQEAINACKILNAKPVFAGQVDGNTMVNNEWLNKLQALINHESPDIVFTHWPVDSHKDHQCAGLLTIQTWVRAEKKFLLYFFEVCTGEQTMIFHPTDYVDISDTQEQKKKAIYCHTSQDPPGIYNCGHADMEMFRGRELGVKAAEGFVKMNGSSQGGFSI